MADNQISVIGHQTRLSGMVVSEGVLIIAGEVQGEVQGAKVIIKGGGRVEGDIVCRSLVIEPGGIFDGRSFMSGRAGGEDLAPEKA